MRWLTTMVLLGLACCWQNALADDITGELVFKKKPTFAGVIYVMKNDASPVNAELDQKNKKFTHKLIVVSPGGEIIFNNSDTFEHNIYASSSDKTANFDVGLMPVGATSTIKANWAPDSVIRIGCKIHPKMKAYIANIPSDQFQTLEFTKKVKNYSINLASVSGDVVTLKLKIPKYQDVVVALKPGEEKTLDVIKKGKVKATITLQRN